MVINLKDLCEEARRRGWTFVTLRVTDVEDTAYFHQRREPEINGVPAPRSWSDWHELMHNIIGKGIVNTEVLFDDGEPHGN